MLIQRKRNAAACLMAAVALSIGVLPIHYAFASTSEPTAMKQDFTKLSGAGSHAMDDVRAARSALFNGDPDDAAHLLAQAKTAMKAAASDDSAFLRAASSLTDAAGKHQSPAGEAQTAWLPVAGDVVILDDFAGQPIKAKAVDHANAALKSGDRSAAIRALKLADVNVDYTVDVVPLAKTATRIDQASALLDAGKYYEAGQVLRQIQGSVRFDHLDINAVPQAASRG
ncbi:MULTISPECIES: YfdX family protein [Burkholderia]|uniref:YfdX family protein n=1 Tax=Burkholderia TaxID=32008 RepID=UPI000BEF6D8B|nr:MULTISPECIES: YfdX family protein [Burkholderia]MBU9166368.1 YfdX family protein [Burkholderia gladioli]MBU9194699.1 YfdX family protein [Burkholderia gladioli]MBU9212534.1 YfdX family protein [Burkholderia gladioli]MBU9380562.1 YfdX family protein [Burkholderia gladioli]MDC6128818.1 YfdX family protein [Burkholderia gladioli]